jgi:ubiquinone/menaquinone biosynthesis C-methylase UbiE/DNA-binding transcriptional ArsR family regulator
MTQKQVEFWDRNAETWGKMTREDLYSDVNLERILRSLPIPGRHLKILDIGTGAGKMAIQASLLGHMAVGVDSSGEMLKQARANAKHFGVRVMLMREDAEFLNFKQGLFDVLIAKDVLFCLDDVRSALSKWSKLLNPNGFLVIIDGNYMLHNKLEDFERRRSILLRLHGTDDLIETLGPDIDHEKLRELIKDNYASKVRRPEWEIWYLSGLGFDEFGIRHMDKFDLDVFTSNGMLKVPCKYILTARRMEEASLVPDTDCSPSSEDFDEKIVKALSNDVRLDIVRILGVRDMDVTDIKNQLGIPQNDASYHLKVLRTAGIVERTRAGKRIVYSLADPARVNYVLNSLYVLRREINSRKKRGTVQTHILL